MDRFKTLLDSLLLSERLLIASHRGPDPDGLGAELGLAHLLREKGKDVIICNHDTMALRFRFLDPEGYVHSLCEDNPPEVQLLENRTIVSVDNSDLKRSGEIQTMIQPDLSNLIVIDHHDGKKSDDKIWFLWPEIGSTCEIIYELIQLSGVSLPAHVAQAVYAGIIVDSGNFRYNKTRPRTHEIAADLLRAGVETALVGELLHSQWPVARLHGRRKLYESLQVNQSETIAYFKVFKEDLDEMNVSFDDLEGIINELIEPAQILVGVIFSAREENITRLSLRSKAHVDLLPAVQKYNGGGHRNACGASIPLDLDRAVREFLPQLEALLGI